MIDELVSGVLRIVVEVVGYWIGKLVLWPFGIRCSADDAWGLRRKKRGKVKPPWRWTRSGRTYLRSDLVQFIGIAVLCLAIAAAISVWLLVRAA